MQKLILGSFVTVISIAIALTTSVKSATAQVAGEYIDSSSPQTVEKISTNIVTFKDIKGESRNYYVPTWMLQKYDLKVGSTMNLYNRNVIQGIYRDTYIDVVSQGLPENKGSFMIDDNRRDCSLAFSPASAGIGLGKRVWYKPECCPSTIPVIGAMWFYQPREIVSIVTERRVISPPQQIIPPITPAPVPVKPPVQGLW